VTPGPRAARLCDSPRRPGITPRNPAPLRSFPALSSTVGSFPRSSSTVGEKRGGGCRAIGPEAGRVVLSGFVRPRRRGGLPPEVASRRWGRGCGARLRPRACRSAIPPCGGCSPAPPRPRPRWRRNTIQTGLFASIAGSPCGVAAAADPPPSRRGPDCRGPPTDLKRYSEQHAFTPAVGAPDRTRDVRTSAGGALGRTRDVRAGRRPPADVAV